MECLNREGKRLGDYFLRVGIEPLLDQSFASLNRCGKHR